MARSISLTRTPYRAQGHAYRYVYAAVGTNTPSEVFVMQNGPLDPAAGTVTARYQAVARPEQLTTLPVGSPVGAGTQFRAASYDRTYADRVAADDDWAALQEAVTHLLRALTAADAALSPETVNLTG